MAMLGWPPGGVKKVWPRTLLRLAIVEGESPNPLPRAPSVR